MTVLLVQILTGIAGASSLFLVAAGLTVIFGVTRVVNFSHGSLYMLGAYIAWSVFGHLPHTPLGFVLSGGGGACARHAGRSAGGDALASHLSGAGAAAALGHLRCGANGAGHRAGHLGCGGSDHRPDRK